MSVFVLGVQTPFTSSWFMSWSFYAPDLGVFCALTRQRSIQVMATLFIPYDIPHSH